MTFNDVKMDKTSSDAAVGKKTGLYVRQSLRWFFVSVVIKFNVMKHADRQDYDGSCSSQRKASELS